MTNNGFVESLKYLERAKKVIPVCSQTFSKAYTYYPFPEAPVYLERGNESHVWDVDGNEYIDFIMGLGPITLGYNYPRVNEAIRAQLDEGIIFSLPHPLEVELAELICDIIPCAEMVRFSKTGSEVCQAAIRAARAYTGKDTVAFRGYHGWHEWYAIATERVKGIPEDYMDHIVGFDYNNIESLKEAIELYDVGTVIMEPVIIEPPRDNFLRKVRELCDKKGVVLIFDEIVTGFRWTLGGAQEYFDVVPDLATFGKGIANGMPLAAVCGKREIMKEFEEVFFSTTFGGECLSLAAGLATIQEMREKDTIEYVWDIGKRLVEGMKKVDIGTKGYACRPVLDIAFDSAEEKALFVQEYLKRGILIHSSLMINLCYSHSGEDIDRAIEVCGEALDIVAEARKSETISEKLQGQVIKPAFRRL